MDPENPPPARTVRGYLDSVERQWAKDYYAWAKANVKAEVWTMAAGVITPAAATLVAYWRWPENFPVSLAEAIGAAAFLGVVGGIAASLLLFLGSSLKFRLLAPYRLWSADQQAIDALTKTRAGLEAEALKQAEGLAGQEIDIERLRAELALLKTNSGSEIAHLIKVNAELGEERSRLQEQLDARQRLELIPMMGDEEGPVAIMPITFGDIEGPEEDLLDRTVVTSTLSILAINNGDHPTTIVRLWLRVSEPSTGTVIVPLSQADFGPWGSFMPPVEEFKPADGAIEARGKRQFELKFTACYPGDFGRRVGARKERAGIIALCVDATGLGTMCFPLPEEFFFDSPMHSEDPAPPTASGQVPPSSRESSG